MPGPPEKERAYQGELATTAVKESGAERHPGQTAQQHTGTENKKIWSRPSCFAVLVALLWEHFLKTLIVRIPQNTQQLKYSQKIHDLY